MNVNVASLPITVGVGAFLVRGGGLLVVRKTYGPSKALWTIPSGYVEPGESIAQTIVREVREETGIAGRPDAIVAVRNRVTSSANDTFLVFTMGYDSGEPRPDGVEVSEAAFVPLEELAVSDRAASFTRAMIPKVSRSVGLHLDPYVPPVGQLESLAYLLYV
ncbi:MAG TPA: NUDIX domain-containing protein [Thermoplasmata archaeon]|nr:NUDIX domain-containing protein [Thermoplasmata archaeon]